MHHGLRERPGWWWLWLGLWLGLLLMLLWLLLLLLLLMCLLMLLLLLRLHCPAGWHGHVGLPGGCGGHG